MNQSESRPDTSPPRYDVADLVIDENGCIAERVNEMGDTKVVPAEDILDLLQAPRPSIEPPSDGEVLPVDSSKIPPPRRTDSANTSHHVGPISEIAAELRQKAEYPTVGPVHTRIIPVRLLQSAAAAIEGFLSAPSHARRSTLADELERLSARATEGPWAWDQRGEKVNEWGLGTAFDKNEKQISGRFEDEDAIYDEYVCSHEAATCNYTNPALICALRNNLPEIVAALRSAQPSATLTLKWNRLAELAEAFPELNPNNFDEEDVRRLNNWGIEVYQAFSAPMDGTAKEQLSHARRSTLADELERLSARATEGPWAWDQRGEKVNEWGLGTAFDKNEKQISGRFEDEDAIYDEYVCSHEAATCNYTNPALICALRNNLPEIVAALRSAQPSAIGPTVDDLLVLLNRKGYWANESNVRQAIAIYTREIGAVDGGTKE